MKEIAWREGVDDSYVSRMVNLTTLAPDIVTAILDETLPPEVTLQFVLLRIMQHSNLAVSWVADHVHCRTARIHKLQTVWRPTLAVGILKSAAAGEHNPERLRDAVLMRVV